MSSGGADSHALKPPFTIYGARSCRRGSGMSAATATTRPIQDELAARVALIGMRATATSTATLAAEIDAIRAAALTHGLFPAVAVTHAIEAALARGERGTLVLGWLAILRDAVASDRHDGRACETYAAACSVRLTG